MSHDPQDKYESIQMILKSRLDRKPWFDILFDYITENCEGDPDSEENTCTCGLESMGGSSGTLQQCFDHQTSVGQGLQPINLARAIVALNERRYGDDSTSKAIEWAQHEIEFEEGWVEFEESWDEEEESVVFETMDEAIEWLTDDKEEN